MLRLRSPWRTFARKTDYQIISLVRRKMVPGNALLEVNCATRAPSVRMDLMRGCPKLDLTVSFS